MANERKVTIVIDAKNASEAELQKARLAVAGFKKDAEGASGATLNLGAALRAAGPLAAAFGVSLGIGTVVSFGKSLLADADALMKLSDKTGIAIEPLQRLKHVAEQSGNTLEQMTGAVSMLQKRLGDGDDSAIGALKGLGIAVDGFMRMSPDQQFRAIAIEVGKIEDPVRRVHVATELFGRAGAELLPSLIANFDELAAAAGVMSAKTVEALDRTGDKLDEVAKKAKVAASEVAVTIIDVFSELPTFIAGAMQGGISQGAVMAHAEALGKDLALRAVKGIKDGFGVLADDGGKLGFDMFADRNVAGMKRLSTAAAAEAKRIAAAHEQAAEEASIAWRTAWDEMTRGGRAAVSALQGSFKQLGDGTLVQVLDIGQALKQFEFLKWQIEGVRDVMPPFMAALPTATGNMTAPGTKTSLTAGLGDAFAAFPTLMMQSLTGGGGVSGAFSAFGSQVGSTLGKNAGGSLAKSVGGMFGNVLGDLLPGLGAMLGPAIGWLSSKFGKTEGKHVNDLRDAFVSAAGGLADLNSQAAAAGTTLDALLKAKTVKEYETAVAALNAKLAQTAAIQGELAGLQQQLADRQTMNWQTAEELATKYGGTLGTLGQQFVAAKQQASFKEVWDDWQTLIDMGADVGGVLVSMKDEIGALVGESLRIGTEIPEQFKPLIEELIRTGQLFDDTGAQITDISTLTFGAPLVSATDALITKINELIETLKNGLTPAINAIPSRVHVKVGYELEDFPELPGYPAPAYASGALITAPHLAMVGEGGQPELIGPVGFMAEALAGAFASMGLGGGRSSDRLVVENHVHVIARNGRELAEVVAPELPDALSRYGIKVR